MLAEASKWGHEIHYDRSSCDVWKGREIRSRRLYDEETQLRALRRTADAMLALFATVDPSSSLAESRAQVLQALGELVGWITGFKGPAWAEEKEWRAVHVVPHGDYDGVMFRPSNGVAVPYITEEIFPLLREILLASSGYSDVTIRASSIPLRS